MANPLQIPLESARLRLRPTQETDLPYVLQAEQHQENSSFIMPWSAEQHRLALTQPDLTHLIIEKLENNQPAGFILLAGLGDANNSIEFRRIVITEKGAGFGKEAVGLVKRLAFERLKAHRLWLDVKDYNQRARHLYEAEGFVVEGILRECLKNGDNYESLVIMAILESEYLTPTKAL